MMEKMCAINGCASFSNENMFKFPNPEQYLEHFKLWIAATGNINLLDCHPLKIYFTMGICNEHFESEYWSIQSHLKPIPYLNVPDPLTVPGDWIICVQDNDNINVENTETIPTFAEDDIFAKTDIWGFTYTTVNQSVDKLSKMYESSKIDVDEKTNTYELYNLWSTSIPSLNCSANEGIYPGENRENVRKYTQFVLTKPSEYYQGKINTLTKMYEQQLHISKELGKENNDLKKKVKELKKVLYRRHI